MSKEQQIYKMLSDKGMLQGMSFEQFSKLPPRQKQEIMQSARQSMQIGGEFDIDSTNQILGSLNNATVDQGAVDATNDARTTAKAKQKASRQQKAGKVTGDVVAGAAPALLSSASGLIKRGDQESTSTANTAGDILSDAGTGAAIGSTFGPYGTLIGGAAGAMFGVGKKVIGAEDPEATGTGTDVGSLGTQLAQYGGSFNSGMNNPVYPSAYNARPQSNVSSETAEKAMINKIKNRGITSNTAFRSGKLGTGAGMRNAGYDAKQPFFNDKKTKKNMYSRVGYQMGGMKAPDAKFEANYDLNNEQVMAIMRRNLMMYGGTSRKMMNGGNPEYHLMRTPMGYGGPRDMMGYGGSRNMMAFGGTGNSGYPEFGQIYPRRTMQAGGMQPEYFGRKTWTPSSTFGNSGMSRADYKTAMAQEKARFEAAEDARMQDLRDRASAQSYINSLMTAEGGVNQMAPNTFNNMAPRKPQMQRTGPGRIDVRKAMMYGGPYEMMYGGGYGKKF